MVGGTYSLHPPIISIAFVSTKTLKKGVVDEGMSTSFCIKVVGMLN